MYGVGQPAPTHLWYLNGAIKEKSTVAGVDDGARTQREKFSDDGKLGSRETLTAIGAVVRNGNHVRCLPYAGSISRDSAKNMG